MDLTAPVTSLPGIGPVMGKKLTKLGIYSVFDLLYHLPFRYEDRSRVAKISGIQAGETATIVGVLTSLKNDYTKRGKNIQSGVITDSTGSLPVTWFNQTYLTRTLSPGTKITLYGKVEFFGPKKTLVSPEYEVGESLIHMGRIVPVYPETSGVSSKWLRTKIFNLLPLIPQEIYPAPSPAWKTSLSEVHFPSRLPVDVFKKRLAFDELLFLYLTSFIRRQNWNKTKLSHIFSVPYPQIRQFIQHLPFSLSPSQNRAVDEILTDLSTPNPMNRLLEGDVGSGKTVVAAIAAYAAHLNGFQTLVLAPTQILAHQHSATLTKLFNQFDIKVGCITGSQKLNLKHSTLNIIVGTHALLTQKFPKVGLVVIDEQHRFGVAQRGMAASKGETPHILTMTATPIPRTIALTLYGDLDLSVLQTLPDRQRVKTWLVPEQKRAAGYEWIQAQHTQVFIVCPFIETSETLKSVKAASVEFDKLKSVFPDSKLGLLHGKLKPAEKEAVVSKFRAGELDILVSTPVVEVGIDIPNATIMVVEAADRFGLAQLHQLRGRVGRSSSQSYCLLFSDTDTTRLKALENHDSGIELAEIDLRLRGPGQILGTAQSGLPDFKVATYDDLGQLNSAKTLAHELFPNLAKYPILLTLLKKDKIELVQPN